MTDDELCRIRDHAAANPSHAGDAVLRLVAEVDRLTRERDAIQAVAVKLQAYIYTDDTQDRSYDAEALAAVRKKAGLDVTATGKGTR